MIDSLKFYILNDQHEPVEVEMMEWATDHSHRIVKQERIGNADVSTIFIGMGDYMTGRPYFETMIFGGPLDMYQERCNTYDWALVQHSIAKDLVLALPNRKIKEDE